MEDSTAELTGKGRPTPACLFKQRSLESGGVDGDRKLALDMLDLGERCSKHRVARMLKAEGLRSQTRYRRRPGIPVGKVVPNHLQRQFNEPEPNESWITNST